MTSSEKNDKDGSIEEILKSIRDIINNKDVNEVTANSKESDTRNEGIKPYNVRVTSEGVVSYKDSNDDILELTNIVKGEGYNHSESVVEQTNLNSNLFRDLRQSNERLKPRIPKQVLNKNETVTNVFQEPRLKNFNSDCLESKDDNVSSSLISEKIAMDTTNVLKQFSKQVTMATQEQKKRNLGIEEFVIELIKPELSQWLDKNLPILVRQIVEQEIKRLIPDDDNK